MTEEKGGTGRNNLTTTELLNKGLAGLKELQTMLFPTLGNLSLLFCQRQILEELYRKATTNPISGGQNTRVLDQVVKDFTKGYVAQIDIDNFKELNDIHGHDYGDRVLKELYNFLYSNLRSKNSSIETEKRQEKIGEFSDMEVIHEHGEEFKILLQVGEKAIAYSIMERLRKGFFNYTRDTKTIFIFPVTFSAGLSYYNKQEKTIEQAFKEADKAMYEAKEMKNKTCIYRLPAHEQLELGL